MSIGRRERVDRLTLKCPHCGEHFQEGDLKEGALIPTHDFPKPCRMVCPGSGQIPRSLQDERPLWKDQGL